MATFKQKTFNINTEYKRLVHRPLCTDKAYRTDKDELKEKTFVMYVHSDDWKADKDTTVDETESERSEVFKIQKEKTYNSPTNIRRVFITGRGVGVQYYISPVISGQRSEVKWQFKSYSGEESLFDIADKIMNYNIIRDGYTKSVQKSETGKSEDEPPVKYTITGNGIGLLSTPWVCSNVEEIYFDWTLLLSDNVKPYFQNIFGKNIQEITQKTMQLYAQQGIQMQQGIQWDEAITRLMKASKKNMTVNNSCVFEFFKRYCSGGVSEVQNRFPRLRTIAMVQNLDSILDDAKVVDQSFTSVEEGMQTWIELNKSLVESNGGLVVKYSFKNVLRYNDQFITRKGLWKLDSLLADRFDSMKQKIVEAKRATYKTETATVESTEQTLDNSKINKAGFKNGFSDLEITLEAASKKYQAKSVASSLYYMSMSSKFKPSEWSAMLGRISDINREKYEKLTGRKAGESSNFSNSDIVELEKGFVDSFYSILWFVMKAVDGNSLITEMCNKYEVLAKACANDEESIKYISINKEPMSSLMDEVTFTIIVSEYTNNGKLVGNEYRYLNHTLSESAKSAGEDKTGKGYIKAAYNILLNTFNRL